MGVVAGSGPLRSHRDDIGQGGASGLGAPDVPTAARPLPVLRVTTLSEPLFQGQPCGGVVDVPSALKCTTRSVSMCVDAPVSRVGTSVTPKVSPSPLVSPSSRPALPATRGLCSGSHRPCHFLMAHARPLCCIQATPGAPGSSPPTTPPDAGTWLSIRRLAGDIRVVSRFGLLGTQLLSERSGCLFPCR